MNKTCLFKYSLPKAIQRKEKAGFIHLDNVSGTFSPLNFHLKQDDCFPFDTFNDPEHSMNQCLGTAW